MVKDAERHGEEDKQRRADIETRNHADTLVYNTEKMLNENREKIPVGDIKPIEDALAEAKEALKSEDMDKIRSAMETLTKASHRLAEVMYKQAKEKQATAGPGEGEQAQAKAGRSRRGGCRGRGVRGPRQEQEVELPVAPPSGTRAPGRRQRRWPW